MKARIAGWLVAGLAVAALSVPSARADQPPSPSMIGVNKAYAHLFGAKGAAAMGARYDRVPFMQTDPVTLPDGTTTYPDQAADDRIFGEQETPNGMRVLPLLLPKFKGFAAGDVSAFVKWADWFMKRYGAGGAYWSDPSTAALAPTIFEVGNEVYAPWSEPSAPYDAGDYDNLFKQVVADGRAIRADFRFLFSATDYAQDAQGNVVGKWAYLVADADSTIGNYIDGLATHPYSFRPQQDRIDDPVGFDSTGYDRVTTQTRSFFADRGISKPIYITEVGLCTSPQLLTQAPLPCGTDANQVAAIDYWFSDFRKHSDWIYALMIYQYEDCVPDQPCDSATNLYLNNKEAWFGLVDRFGVPKPGYAAFKAQALQTQ